MKIDTSKFGDTGKTNTNATAVSKSQNIAQPDMYADANAEIAVPFQETPQPYQTQGAVTQSAPPQADEYEDVEIDISSGATVIHTDAHSHDGQNKCPKCGATDIAMNPTTGMLHCNYCRYEFAAESVDELSGDPSKLRSRMIGSGARDIIESTDDVITLKCESCGAEVVVNTTEASQARCHWCRNYLSINNQLPNGSIPDAILPFTMAKEEARQHIESFVGSRKFFAHPTFKREFTTENISGVYFPYYVVDMNTHVHMEGEGEHQTRQYTVEINDHKETRYEAEAYAVERSFDLAIDGLTLEASADKLNVSNAYKTTNIINSIMPFDTENCVRYDANYMKGFTSERRDTNIDQVRAIAEEQAEDIARNRCHDTTQYYDRGISWDTEELEVVGERWSTAYLPVWLYSYYHRKNDGENQLHYVAVNARTKETMGSVPIHYPKLFAISALIEIIALLIMLPLLFIDLSSDDPSMFELALALAGFVFYFVMLARYRNASARHYHESETMTEMSNVEENDVYLDYRKNLKEPWIDGRNDHVVNGTLCSKAAYIQAATQNALDS